MYSLSLTLSLLFYSLMHTHTHILKNNERSLVSVDINDSLGSCVSAESVPCTEDYAADEELASEDEETGNISSELVYESDDLSDDDFNLSQSFATDSDRAEVALSLTTTPSELSTNEITSVEHEPLTLAHPSTEVMTAASVSTELGVSTD